jgi:hypothetical protein
LYDGGVVDFGWSKNGGEKDEDVRKSRKKSGNNKSQ